jgi:hypothetical protein
MENITYGPESTLPTRIETRQQSNENPQRVPPIRILLVDIGCGGYRKLFQSEEKE